MTDAPLKLVTKPGWVGFWVEGQAKGAYPNGSRVKKVATDPKDAHPHRGPRHRALVGRPPTARHRLFRRMGRQAPLRRAGHGEEGREGRMSGPGPRSALQSSNMYWGQMKKPCKPWVFCEVIGLTRCHKKSTLVALVKHWNRHHFSSTTSI